MNDYLTPAQAARVLGLTPKRVSQLARNGELRCVMTPLGRLYSKAVVRDYALGRGIAVADDLI